MKIPFIIFNKQNFNLFEKLYYSLELFVIIPMLIIYEIV